MPAIIAQMPDNKFLQVRMPRPVLDSYRALAKEEGVSLSALTRRLIAEELTRTGKEVSITVNLIQDAQ